MTLLNTTNQMVRAFKEVLEAPTPIQQNLNLARADLLWASERVHACRLAEFEGALCEMWIKIRHKAADRVWELQCMLGGSL